MESTLIFFCVRWQLSMQRPPSKKHAVRLKKRTSKGHSSEESILRETSADLLTILRENFWGLRNLTIPRAGQHLLASSCGEELGNSGRPFFLSDPLGPWGGR